jgi:hypothetical protein
MTENLIATGLSNTSTPTALYTVLLGFRVQRTLRRVRDIHAHVHLPFKLDTNWLQRCCKFLSRPMICWLQCLPARVGTYDLILQACPTPPPPPPCTLSCSNSACNAPCGGTGTYTQTCICPSSSTPISCSGAVSFLSVVLELGPN